jgi:lipopolysaccharide/colanic/teichoic acid biosynthesis glycosyltransferase
LQQLLNETSDLTVTTVEEKIYLEKQLPFNPNNKTGPTTTLYFHELPSKKQVSQYFLRLVAAIILGILFVLTLPIIALLIKCTSSEPIFRNVSALGRRGIVFQLYKYPITRSETSKPFLIGSFLKKTGCYKLPAVINLWKREINLVGPHPYPAKWCNKWNKQLSDYYKRFALNPGFVGVAKQITNPDNIDEVASTLDQELKYILNPSFKNDLKYLLGIH